MLMPFWQWLVILWLVLWAMQSAGVFLQMRTYSRLTNALMHEFSEGFIGTGTSPRRFGRGSVAIVVVSADMIVRRVVVMSGMTFLARFQPMPEFEGLSLSALVEAKDDDPYPKSLREAFKKAEEQIMRAASRKEAERVNDRSGADAPQAAI
jgi:glucitol operon activator protein